MEQKPKMSEAQIINTIEKGGGYLKDFGLYYEEFRAHRDEFPNKPFPLYEHWKKRRANANA